MDFNRAVRACIDSFTVPLHSPSGCASDFQWSLKNSGNFPRSYQLLIQCYFTRMHWTCRYPQAISRAATHTCDDSRQSQAMFTHQKFYNQQARTVEQSRALHWHTLHFGDSRCLHLDGCNTKTSYEIPLKCKTLGNIVWNFAQSTAASLPCSVHNSKTIEEQRNWNWWQARFCKICD